MIYLLGLVAIGAIVSGFEFIFKRNSATTSTSPLDQEARNLSAEVSQLKKETNQQQPAKTPEEIEQYWNKK